MPPDLLRKLTTQLASANNLVRIDSLPEGFKRVCDRVQATSTPVAPDACVRMEQLLSTDGGQGLGTSFDGARLSSQTWRPCPLRAPDSPKVGHPAFPQAGCPFLLRRGTNLVLVHFAV